MPSRRTVKVNGVCLLEPPGVSAARFLGNPLLQSLWVNDVATSTRSWEEASQDALHQLLSRLAGVSREALQEHTDLDISIHSGTSKSSMGAYVVSF